MRNEPARRALAAPPRPRPSGPRRSARLGPGFTLVELLLVMTLIGIVLGVGLGSFASFDPARGAARGLVA
ncbi:MAG: prepilin-type N-terminal cleavage/methylation domain-containing protein, partial [Planctomycetota bacterium]